MPPCKAPKSEETLIASGSYKSFVGEVITGSAILKRPIESRTIRRIVSHGPLFFGQFEQFYRYLVGQVNRAEIRECRCRRIAVELQHVVAWKQPERIGVH